MGDPADGIPGIPRWGAKSSAAVLASYGAIEQIPASHEAWTVKVRGAAALANNLEENRQAALLYKQLATLRTDVPLTETLADLSWKGPRPDELNRLCDEIGDRRVCQRMGVG